MSSAMARGSATQPPEPTPERVELLEVRAFTLDRIRALEVSPQRESDTAPPLAVSKDVAAETLSRSENTETDLSARLTIGDEVSPLTIDTSTPVSTENSGSLHHGRRDGAPLGLTWGVRLTSNWRLTSPPGGALTPKTTAVHASNDTGCPSHPRRASVIRWTNPW